MTNNDLSYTQGVSDALDEITQYALSLYDTAEEFPDECDTRKKLALLIKGFASTSYKKLVRK